MQSTNITAKRIENFFALTLNICEQFISIKLDTGACNTVISAELLYGELSNEKKKAFKEYCIQHNINSQPFEVTTGHTMEGYPVEFNDVEVNGVIFKHFFCYIIIDIEAAEKCENCTAETCSKHKNNLKKKRFALLGDEFLDCCGYYHKPHGNFEITSFDDEEYSIKGMIIPGYTISEILS